jgi:redox-sensing transcriptional repressor
MQRRPGNGFKSGGRAAGAWRRGRLACEGIHKPTPVKKIAESTVRRLSIYLRFLEEFEGKGLATISSDELARRGGTTSAQVRKDLSFFGSFGKRGLGYSVPELAESLRDILGLGREWRVIIVGAGKIGAALAQYRGFHQRGFRIVAAYDTNPDKIGRTLDGVEVRDSGSLEGDIARNRPDIAVIAVPSEHAQETLDRLVRAGVTAVLNFAAAQIHAPPEITVKTVNMAMELEGLTFALTNRE